MGARFFAATEGRTFFTEDHCLNELSLYSTPLSTFPPLPYFPGSILRPNIFPAAHHNQAIHTKLSSVSTLRYPLRYPYASPAAEDLTAQLNSSQFLSVLGQVISNL